MMETSFGMRQSSVAFHPNAAFGRNPKGSSTIAERAGDRNRTRHAFGTSPANLWPKAGAFGYSSQ